MPPLFYSPGAASSVRWIPVQMLFACGTHLLPCYIPKTVSGIFSVLIMRVTAASSYIYSASITFIEVRAYSVGRFLQRSLPDAPAAIRIYDRVTGNPVLQGLKSFEWGHLRESESPAYTIFPDLHRLSRLWPHIPEAIRRAIIQIAEATVATQPALRNDMHAEHQAPKP